jgi:hypothetical protein
MVELLALTTIGAFSLLVNLKPLFLQHFWIFLIHAHDRRERAIFRLFRLGPTFTRILRDNFDVKDMDHEAENNGQ